MQLYSLILNVFTSMPNFSAISSIVSSTVGVGVAFLYTVIPFSSANTLKGISICSGEFRGRTQASQSSS